MRTLPARIQTEINSPVQSPSYLIEINFSTTIRLCTRDAVTVLGYNWLPAGVQVGQLAMGQGGTKTISITIANNAFAFSTIVLAESAAGKTVRVWKLFGNGPYVDDDAVLLFDGEIDEVPDMVEKVTLNCATRNARTLSIPNITIGAPYFNFLPRAGQIIVWGSEQYQLEPR